MIKNGTSGMGSTKHGKSGKPPKSPKARMAMQLACRDSDIKPKKSTLKNITVNELFNPKGK